ncbi:MAG: hypothetical protein HYX88_03700 [Chloroflexi bacterium]|nr:hypothetical protein [Chloroflexota bacterium]
MQFVVDPQWLTAYGTIILAFGTAALAVVAVFQHQIRGWLTRPDLTLSITVSPPDCHKTLLFWQQAVGTLVSLDTRVAEAYYFRLRIGNEGKTSARNVEVFGESLKLSRLDGTLETVDRFLPMNFLWANTKEVYFPSIAPKMWKHCDLGHIVDPKERREMPGEDDPNLPLQPGQSVFSLELMVKPHTLSHLIPPGSYQLTVVAAAANADPVRKVIELGIPGTWHEDEADMLARGIGLRVL